MNESIQSQNQSLAEPSIIDKLERAIVESLEPVDLKTEHFFIPGEYIRRIHMPAGTCLTSKIHGTRHPFKVTEGECIVYNELGDELGRIVAPHCGITEPGTRRAIRIIRDTVWTTYHTNEDDETDLAVIEERVILKHENPLLACRGSLELQNEGEES